MKKKFQLIILLLFSAIALQAQWLFWGDGGYQNFQGNPWAGVQLDLALRFAPSDLAAYEGKSITKIKFHPGPVPNMAAYQLKIWEAQPGALPELMYSQSVEGITFGQWNEFELTSAWAIDTSKELWFGVSISQGGSVGFDAGPAEPGKGNKFGNGIEWYDWGSGNWTIQAFADDASPTLYTLSLLADPEEGGVVAGGGNFQAGEIIPVEATANEGYEFQYWLNGDEQIFDPAFEFTMPADDVTLTAVFEPAFQPEWLFWGDGEYSNFQSNPWAGVQLDLAQRFEPADISDYNGKLITKMKFHPGPIPNAANYQLKIWEANAGDLPVLMYSQPVSSITFDDWNEITLTTPWTINSAKELWFGVSISQGGNVGYDAGPAEPGKGNKFGNGIEWYDWGTGNWLVQALITGSGAPSYNLTLVSNPEEGGTVSGAGTYQAGENIELEAVANPDFAFINWTKGSEVISTSPNFTFTMPEENVTLTANFETTIPQYTLSLTANPANGGTLTGAGEYAGGEEITIAATENEGFSFVNWMQNGAVISTEATFQFVMPAENTGLVANFALVYPDFYEANIGEGQQFPQEVRMPFDFDWRNSISQTLYYPEELGISRGIIDQLTYYKNFSQDVMGKGVKVWMGETTRRHLSSGWISPSELTLVFDGMIDFPQGQGEINIQLDEPFQYNGGILVIYSNRAFEQQYYSWNERFYATQDAGNARTRQFNEDVPIDPMNPSLSANYVLDWHPNITISFPTAMLGGIEGIVTDGVLPLEGVKVTIEGTTAETYTNSNGYYSIPFIQADTYEIRFSKLGFLTHIEVDYEIEAGGVATLEAALNASDQVDVTGVIQGNDGVPVGGAEILLSGNSDYSAISGLDGTFLLEGAYEGLYSLAITAENYELYLDEDVLITDGNSDLGTIILTEKIIPPLGLTVDTENQDPGNALLNWYHGETREYRYDNGTYTYWVGSAEGDINSVFGSAYRSDAVITKVSWYLTSEPGIVYPEVKIWVFGLDQSGMPDTSRVLYTKENVSNINDEWNTHELDYPVVAPNGFLVGISYAGFYALGCDDGLDPEWPFRENTLFYVEYGETDFLPIETLVSGWELNFMIRAYGVNNQEIEQLAATNPEVSAATRTKITAEKAVIERTPSAPFLTTQIENSFRELTGYHIFLDDLNEPVATINEKQYLLEHLPTGNYTAGVRAVYTSGFSEMVTKSFEIAEGAPPQIIHLPEGWSGWSAYNIPAGDGSFASVVAPVAQKMTLSQYFNQLYYPQYGINSMGDFSNMHGYISKMNDNAELAITGLRAETTITLAEGWNLLPVLSHCNVDVIDLFGQLPELIIAYEVAGNGMYWPGHVNTLQTLSPGRAYWVKVSGNCTLSFPQCPGSEKSSYIAPLRCTAKNGWNQVVYSGVSHVVVFGEEAVGRLQPGDMVGAFTTEGKCAGLAAVESSGFGLALYGDDLTTEDKDGFSEAEEVSWLVYRPSEDRYFSAGISFHPNSPTSGESFTAMGVSLVRNIDLKALSTLQTDNENIIVFPNPSGGLFYFSGATSSEMDYFITGSSGVVVKKGIISRDQMIDLTGMPDGVYFLYTGDRKHKPVKLIKK